MITAPGAPSFQGLALPVSTPPRPSPSHQIATDQATEPASANLAAGRQAIPRAMISWMVAKATFVTIGCCSMMPADQVIGSEMRGGLPWADVASDWPNARVNMNGWDWSGAASSQG